MPGEGSRKGPSRKQRFSTLFIPWRTYTSPSEAHQKMLCFLPICQKISMISIHSHWVAFVVLAAVIFLFGSQRDKWPVPLSKHHGSACLKPPCSAG